MDNTGNAGILSSLSNQLADAVEKIGPALVLVNGRQRLPSSGVVYKQGLVLTAEHTLEREEDITVETHDGQKLPAQFVGRDSSSDLAVLRVPDLTVEPAGSGGDPRVGQLALAVGRPSDSGLMASQGIVSAVGGPMRTGRGGMLEKYIRTDATPYPGFSGGPLIDSTGAVLGILTTGLAGGVALAVPTSVAWRIADTLTQHGRIKRGYLGISSQPVYLPEAQRGGGSQETGLLIVRVEQDTPAEKGGLLIGDILVSLDGMPIAGSDDLQALLSGERVGSEVPVQVIRGGTLQTLNVMVGQRD